MEIFSRIAYPDSFLDKPADCDGLVNPAVFADDKLPEDTGIFLPPTVVPVSGTPGNTERKNLICLARLLVRENRTRAKLLEACRVWAVVENDRPDEYLYEFMAAADELFQILSVAEKPAEGHSRGTHYAGLLPFLDRAAEQNPEVAGYCRCAVWYRLAGIYGAMQVENRNRNLPQSLGNFFENIPHYDEAGNPSLYTRVFNEFGRFTRTYGPQYLPDYLSLVKQTSGDFGRYEKFKRIWPSMLVTEKWLRALAEKDPLAHAAQYGELLALYSDILGDMRGTESAVFDNTGNNPREHAASRDLRFCQGDWREMASVIRRYRTMDDDVYLIFLANSLNLHFEGSPARSLSLPGRIRIALLGRIGYHRLDRPTTSLIRGWQNSADTLWAAAEKMSRSPGFSENDFFEILKMHLQFVDRMNDIAELSGNYQDSEKYLRRLVAVTRYLWKVEEFYFPLEHYRVPGMYRNYLKKLRRNYERQGNKPGMALCDEELFSIDKPYESAFGEKYRDLSAIAALNEQAKFAEGELKYTGNGRMKIFEVGPGRYLFVRVMQGHGQERWSYFPDRFLNQEQVDCPDLDLSLVINALDRYRRFMESNF